MEINEKERLENYIDNLSKEIKELIIKKANGNLQNEELINQKRQELLSARTALKLAAIREEKGRRL